MKIESNYKPLVDHSQINIPLQESDLWMSEKIKNDKKKSQIIQRKSLKHTGNGMKSVSCANS